MPPGSLPISDDRMLPRRLLSRSARLWRVSDHAGSLESRTSVRSDTALARRICRPRLRSGGVLTGGLLLCVVAAGCQDGPLYALKEANPWFSVRQWGRDEAIGVTDHTRREELMSLAETIDRLPADRQAFWNSHLQQIYANDKSPEMRRLVVLAAGKSVDPSMLELVQAGLDDDSLKVRMEACRALGRRPEEDAARMLATVLGKTQDKDVRHAAIAAIGRHPGPVANNALKLALQDRDPATQTLVISSLRQSTGRNYGDDPEVWIAALDGESVEERPADGGFMGLF